MQRVLTRGASGRKPQQTAALHGLIWLDMVWFGSPGSGLMRSPSFVAAILRSVRDEQRPQCRDDNDGSDERQRYDATVVDAIKNGLRTQTTQR